MSERMFAIIGSELNVKPKQVQAAVELLDEGNTVPFIARYRKEVTGELQESNCAPLKNVLNTCATWKHVAKKSLHLLQSKKK